MNPDELARATEVAEIEERVLEGHLRRLDPRTPYARLPGVEVDVGRYSGDDEGRARFRHDLATSRRDWLMGRYEELTAREARRAEAQERRRAGISRFLPGRFNLDALTAPELERQLQVWMAAGPGGGLSKRAAEQNQEALRELRGDPRP